MSGINICFVFVLVSVASVNAYYTWPFKSMLSLRKARSVQMSSSDVILRQIDDWACIKNCGACCKLGPLDSRPDLEEYLTPEEFSTYKSMIGTDDWCIHFDKVARLCTNYDNRPGFCTVDPKKFKVMYGVEDDEFTDFCKFCCTENIKDSYGELSDELDRFEDVMERLESGEVFDLEDS